MRGIGHACFAKRRRCVCEAEVNIGNFQIHDNKGAAQKFTFAAGCQGSAERGALGGDTVTLLNAAAPSSTGKLPGGDRPVSHGVQDLSDAFKVSPGASNKDMLPDKLQVYLNEIADKTLTS